MSRYGSLSHGRNNDIGWAIRYALHPGARQMGSRKQTTTTVATTRHEVGGARRGTFLHRVERVVIGWPPASWGAPARLGALWACGSETADAVLGSIVEDRMLCSRCDFGGMRADLGHVYFAERDGLVKIGCSSNVLPRVAGMGAHLLAIESGGFPRERELHERFAAHRAFGEWFRPARPLMDHIASLTRDEVSA